MTTVGPYIPEFAAQMPQEPFEALLAIDGVRATWQRARACPCMFSGGGPQGRLPFPGSPDPGCRTCLGLGTYWAAPSEPFMVLMTFMHMSPTPDEPGIHTDDKFGPIVTAEPTLTIPYRDPTVEPSVHTAWSQASTNDLFVSVDKQARYNANLQVGGIQAVPYQENLTIAPTDAVVTYDPETRQVIPVSNYSVSGTTVLLGSEYPEGTNYMVEFYASPIYVAYRRAGGLPHIRDFGANKTQLPRRFRLQTLDLWTRSRTAGPGTSYSSSAGGNSLAMGIISGQVMVT